MNRILMGARFPMTFRSSCVVTVRRSRHTMLVGAATLLLIAGGCTGKQRAFVKITDELDESVDQLTPSMQTDRDSGADRRPQPSSAAPGIPARLSDAGPAAPACDACTPVCVPGAAECTSNTSLRECDTNGQWGESSTCTFACANNACGGECVPGASECLSTATVRTCSEEGLWSDPLECSAACVGTECSGECKPASTQCVSTTQVQICGDLGTWGDASDCTNTCIGNACTGECSPDATRCSSTTQLQTCNEQGQWQAPATCPFACVEGQCEGECVPNTGRCNPVSGIPQRCDADGAWQDQAGCPFVCIGSGSCGGECIPNSRRCNPATSVPQLCSVTGSWQNQPSCQFVCSAGFCAGECTPDSRRCDPASGIPQSCSAAGQWQNQLTCGPGSVCAAGVCACNGGLADCGNGCAAVSTDANNCGVCGHSCLGGECSAGTCQPFALAAGQGSLSASPLPTGPTAITVDATSVYWVVQTTQFGVQPTPIGAVRRAPKRLAMGSTVQTIQANQDEPRSIVSDGSTVFWGIGGNSNTAQGALLAAPVAGGAPQTVATGDAPVNDVALAGDFIYWVEHTVTSGQTSFVKRANKTLRNLTSNTTETLASSPAGANQLGVSGSCAYYVRNDNLGPVARGCANGDQDTFFSPTEPAPGETVVLEADGSGVYVLRAGVIRVPLAGGAPVTLEPLTQPGGNGLRDIVTDASFVYFIDGQARRTGLSTCGTDWSIRRVSKEGGPARTIVAAPLACPGRLAVDDTALYWTNRDDGTIMILAK
jgi:hypothetical protein